MFSNTRRCHKCPCHFANMLQTLLFTASLHLHTTCVSLNTSTAGSDTRSWIPKQMSQITWGKCANMSARMGPWVC